MDALTSLFGRSGLLPHGFCLTWSPGLLWTMVASDLVIAAAYFSIPLAILHYVRQRGPRPAPWLAWLFSAFIFACGLTHVMDVWTLWQADYALQLLTKALTAVLSLVTAVALWRLIPAALKIPTVGQLQAAIGALEAEVGRRRTAEQHLAETEQTLSVTLASIEAGFISADAQGRVNGMNAVAEQVTGWRQAEARGQPLLSVFLREGRPAADAARNPVDLMREQGITVDKAQHVIAIARDGSRTAVEIKADLTRDDAGQVRGLAMVFRDMTQLNLAETERQRLAAIVESSNDAIIGKTLDGRITNWNQAAQRLFGYSADEAIGRPVQMLIPPEFEVEEMRILADLAHGQTVPPFDTVRQARDGSRLAVSVTISPIRDALGRVVGGSKIARDVSQQRRAEAALRESEARLRFVLDSSEIGEWDMDLGSGITRRSARHDSCFGLAPSAQPWTLATFLARVHPEDRDEAECSFRRAVRQRQDWQIDCRVLWPDASVHWLRMHGSLLQEDGRAGRMLGIVTDISDQRQAEDARLRAQRLETENRQVLEATRLKSQFLANMSHELRTPLNAIIGFAELLHAGAVPADSPKHREFLGHIGTSGHHLLQLINDVLDLSKVESGKFAFAPEPVDLPRLVGEVIDVLHTAVQRKHLQVTLQLDPALDGLVLDPARLKQVLYNYLSNAIKFTPEGGSVTLRAEPAGAAQFRIEVEDTGIGIAAADLPRLFTEFQQLDAGYSKQHPGTGLGLALTRRLVEAQGGRTGVRSSPGQGSVFSLVLPRVPGGGDRTAAQDPLTGQRWLVVQDAGPLQDRLTDGLWAAGIQADTAATGASALLQARARPYDGLSLHLQLGDQSGLSALAGIRDQGASRQAPVLALNLDTAPDAAASFAIANLLRKPIDAREVVTAMTGLALTPARRARVLVVDDDPLALTLMQATLLDYGADVVCLQDGRQALAELDQHQPDAIVLDLMMPGFDGFAVLDALRMLPRWRDTPVFIWTSLLLSPDEIASLSQSARAILAKGGGALAELLDSVRRWRPAVDRQEQQR